MGKTRDTEAAHCKQVVQGVHFAAEEKQELVAGRRLLVDMRMVLLL